MGADVTVLDRTPEALRRIAAQLGGRVRTLFSTRDVVELLCRRADLVIATVLVPGDARAEAAEVLRVNPKYTIGTQKQVSILKRAEDSDHLIDGLRKAGLPE